VQKSERVISISGSWDGGSKLEYVCAITGRGNRARGAGAGAGGGVGAGQKKFAKSLLRDMLKMGGPVEDDDEAMAACSTF
jgi:hypothetical protein